MHLVSCSIFALAFFSHVEAQVLQKNDGTCRRIGAGALHLCTDAVFQERNISVTATKRRSLWSTSFCSYNPFRYPPLCSSPWCTLCSWNIWLTFQARSWVLQRQAPESTCQAWGCHRAGPSGSSAPRIWLRCLNSAGWMEVRPWSYDVEDFN